MNKSYLIVPLILLIVFGVLYKSAVKEMEAKAERQHAVAEARMKEEKARKDEIERKATADAKKRQDEREEADRAKEEKKVREYEAGLKALADEASKYSGEADKLSKEAADLELEISQTRTNKEKLNSDTFDLAKQVELMKINRRNAELEIQRTVEMVAKKLNNNNVVVPPPPPPLVEVTKK